MEHKVEIRNTATSSFFTADFSFDGISPANYAIYRGEGNFGTFTGEGVSQTQPTGNTGVLPDGTIGTELTLVGHYASTRFDSTGDVLFERGFPGAFTAIADFSTGRFYETGIATITGGTGRFTGATGTEYLIQDGIVQVGGGNPPGSEGAFGFSSGIFVINITIPSMGGIYFGISGGSDEFAFNNPAEGISTIADFTPGSDFISLPSVNFGGSSFTGVGAPVASDGLIDLVTGSVLASATADPTLLYDTTNGALSFDLDGTGGGTATQFATFIGAPILSGIDFTVISDSSVNNAPTLTNNSLLTLNERETATISNTLLQATDIETTPAGITYTVIDSPDFGTLNLNGVALAANSTFTQEDIDTNKLTYINNPVETASDNFTFTVSDGAGGTIGSTVFNIGVAPVNETLNGTSGNDTINGLAGNDTVNGGRSSDNLDGGSGDDIVNGGRGNDNVNGGSGDDTMTGGRGNDNLAGNAGFDIVRGGAGADRFIFNSNNEGSDRIIDFSVLDDTLVVSLSGFGGGLTADAAIAAAQFKVGSAANDVSDRFIYNQNTGSLFFDADGMGGTAQIQFAQLSTGLTMTYRDIFVAA